MNATLEYRCRRCAAVDDTHAPRAGVGARDAVALAIGRDTHDTPLLLTHACDDGGTGVMELIGAGSQREAGDHAVRVVNDAGTRPAICTCSCGWLGKLWNSRELAGLEGEAHLTDQRRAQDDADADANAEAHERERDARRRT